MVQNQACLAMFQSFCPQYSCDWTVPVLGVMTKEIEAMLYKVGLARVMVMVTSQGAITVLPAKKDGNTWIALKATTYVRRSSDLDRSGQHIVYM